MGGFVPRSPSEGDEARSPAGQRLRSAQGAAGAVTGPACGDGPRLQDLGCRRWLCAHNALFSCCAMTHITYL